MSKTSPEIKILSELFRKKYGFAPSKVVRLAGAGSDRRYFRLSGDKERCIGVYGENIHDNLAFLRLSELFLKEGINVPEIYGVADDGLHYILEDLGDISLFSSIQHDDGLTEAFIKESLGELVKIQNIEKDKIERAVVYAPFGRRQIFWDLNYFKYEYLKPSGIEFDEEALENDFDSLASVLLNAGAELTGFMYRDFQSRNIMLFKGFCYFIDYQGGRLGPGIYDAVSFLWQAKAGFSSSFRERMLKFYAEEYAKVSKVDIQKILTSAPIFVLFRTLQVLGAYGFRGLVEKKAHFIESIPGALNNLRELLKDGVLDTYGELKRICAILVNDSRFVKERDNGRLTVEVFSFSYKKGYPADYSGNGGGFMFDCRGMHNPGRYAEYKILTGLDQPVIDFLKDKGETDIFSERAFSLVEPTVERYLKRGFTNLQIGFGCTGGQHRSVYCAERMSRLLADRFPEARIKVSHREQGLEKVYN